MWYPLPLCGHRFLDVSTSCRVLEISYEHGKAALVFGISREPECKPGWVSRLGQKILACLFSLPPILSGSPPQAGRLQTWTVSGLSPSHCPRLLALVRHTTCRCWMPSPQVAEHCHGGARSGRSGQRGEGRETEEVGGELQSRQCPVQKEYKAGCQVAT